MHSKRFLSLSERNGKLDNIVIANERKRRNVMRHLMRKLITYIFILICSFNSFGQVKNELRDILLSKDFLKLKQYINNLPSDNYRKQGDRINSNWKYLRELTEGFQEGIYILEYSVPDVPNSGISTVYSFRVNIITTDSLIIFYDLAEEKNKKVNNEWLPYYNSIATFTNDSMFSVLESKFIKTYGAPLNRNELFIDSIVIGHNCGMAGQDPTEEIQINKWASENNRIEIMKWLKSTNTEKQIYALEGFYKLKEKGVLLTEIEMKTVKNVMQKKGTALHCAGCLNMTYDILKLTAKFKF